MKSEIGESVNNSDELGCREARCTIPWRHRASISAHYCAAAKLDFALGGHATDLEVEK